MEDADYNVQGILADRITAGDLRRLVSFWQRSHALRDDGACGPKTLASIRSSNLISRPPDAVWPLRRLADGRGPAITSEHASVNPSRPNHCGVDIMFPFLAGQDLPTPSGDGGREGRWWVPPGTKAVAFAAGRVIQAGRISTGHRVWILHSEVNLLSGYFHLSDLNVTVGDIVIAGTPLGLVGHNPVDRDPVHLHFELYSGELSAYPQGTLDPAPYLANSKVEDATNGR